MPVKNDNPPRWAVRIKDLRSKLGKNQTQFAAAIGEAQSSVSRWEKGDTRPLPDVFAKMAKIAPDLDKFYFLDEAGLPREFFMGGIEKAMPSELVNAAGRVVAAAFFDGQPTPHGDASMVETQWVPILSDAVAAGNPLTINEQDIDMTVPFPIAWLPKGSKIYGLHVEGDSMEPILRDHDIALVDLNSRDLKKLDRRMVAVYVAGGVTIKWIRKAGKFYQLVPQNTSPRHDIRIVSEDDDWYVVGEVVKWIGEPPPPPKKR